jgi:hypothetical protein
MIIVQLKGGLGNQLFQWAAGLALSEYTGVPLKVDISELDKPDDEIGTVRAYELQHFIYPPQVASPAEIAKVAKLPVVLKYLDKLLPPHKRKVYKEAAFSFDPNFFSAKPPLYLKGYRQSEKYFQQYEGVLRQRLLIRPRLITDVHDVAERLKNSNSVSVHIRRGDYNDPAVLAYHGVLDEAYYQAAIEAIQERVERPDFYVFSDNVSWVRENLTFNAPVTFVSGNLSSSPLHDFYLMSQCRHNIIANSSFSWWAAWLNNYQQKQVVAPKNWFKVELPTKDLIPEGWIRK